MLAKYFARCYDEVRIFEIIGRSGNCSNVPNSDSLWTFVVTSIFPAFDPVW